MAKIKVTINVQTLGELIAEYNRSTKSPLKAVVDALRNKDWCIEVVAYDGTTEQITTGRQFAAVLKRFSSQNRYALIKRAISRKAN
jgi:hypothetical protein